MNYQIHLLRLRHKTLIAIIILCAVLAGTLAIAFDKRTLAVGEGERVVTVYDGDTKLTYITSADTVEEALKRGSIDVSEQDAVEPALDSKLIDRNYKINVYRARPVLVVDGETRTTVVTAQKSARQVVESAGVELYDEDEADVARIDDVVADGAVAQKIVVDRSTPINLNLYGKTDKVRTQAETVGELIEEKGIVMGEKDGVSLPLSTAITANMTVKVWRDGVQTITQEEDIQFEIEQIQDTAREVGYKQIKEAGALGKKNVTYEIEMKNGEVVSRKAIQTVVLKEAKKQVEIIGAKPVHMPYTGGGTKTEWLAASIIPRENWGEADWLVSKESGWNPNAVNPTSGACGLAQALPCSKVPGNPYNPVDSLNWMHGYVIGRYGSWADAVRHSQVNHWY